MDSFSEKIRLIYVPFLFVAIGFITAYTILDWILVIQAGISIKEDIVKFWLPFALPWIPILIWLRPRIKLLTFKKADGHFMYMLIAALAVSVPTIVAQHYLFSATGKLTQLDYISNIDKFEKTKYYTLKNYYFDKEHIAVQSAASYEGKNNEHLDMYLYVAVPILDSRADTNLTLNLRWIGKRYYKQISSYTSDEVKQELFRLFAEKSQLEFEQTDFSQFSYLERLGNTKDHDEYINAIKNTGAYGPQYNVVFECQNEPFEARTGNTLPWTFGALGIGAAFWLLLLLFPRISADGINAFESGSSSPDSELKETLSIFIPKKDFFATPLIVDLNLMVYLVMVFAGYGVISFKSTDLLNWGANFRPLILEGQYWRLLTNTFLHGGLMHIAANLCGLLFVGAILEPVLGKWQFLLIYLITGIAGSIASVYWHEAAVSVGASGAIFGLYGFFLACLLLKVFPPEIGRVFMITTVVFVGFNLVMGFAGAGIDNAAHVGGLVSGFLIGLTLTKQLKRKVEKSVEYVSVNVEP